jgi:hypothetical protein
MQKTLGEECLFAGQIRHFDDEKLPAGARGNSPSIILVAARRRVAWTVESSSPHCTVHQSAARWEPREERGGTRTSSNVLADRELIRARLGYYDTKDTQHQKDTVTVILGPDGPSDRQTDGQRRIL